MNEAIEKFNKVMEEFNDSYTNAKDDKEREKTSLKYEDIINDAEKVLETEMEAEIQKEISILEEEEKAHIEELKKLEKENDVIKESELLLKIKDLFKDNYTNKEISLKFTENQLIEICKELGREETTKGSKIQKVISIRELI